MHKLKDQTLFRTKSLFGNEWRTSRSGDCFTLRNPSTNEVLAEIPQMTVDEVKEVIEIANNAFHKWRMYSAKERSQILRKWFELIQENSDDLASLLVSEEGKPYAEAKGEIAYAASFVEWFSEEAKRVKGDVMAAPERSRRIVTLKEPVGVCAAITPWNFPAAMITRKAAPALAAGCTMIVKPAEQTPLTAFALADLALRAGVPPGVLNVVTGKARIIGGELTANPIVRKITFTGSTEVGRILISQSAATVKKMSMELGGNAPFIVMDDADVEKSVDGLIATKFRNTGQACISANRVYVHEKVYEEFCKKLTIKVSKLKVGDGFEQGIQQGPLIDISAIEKVEEHVADALKNGGRITTGGKRHERGGLFYEPTVILDVTEKMKLCNEETFGPVAPVIKFSSEEEVIRMANDTEYGLAAYLFSSSAERIWRIAASIEAGMIGINTGLISNEVAPFGGIKQSGLGREGSIYGIEEFLELKYLAWEGSGSI